MPEANKEVVRRHYEQGVNKGDIAVATECFAAEYINHIPGQSEPLRGIPAWEKFFRSLRAAFPDLTTTIEHLVGEGDMVAVRHVWRGTHEGHYEGISPTRRPVIFTGADIYRIVDEKIVEEWSEFDELGLLRQLGAVVAMSSIA